MPRFNPLHCILPPFVLEHMAKSADEKVRALAIENIAASAEARAARAMLSQAPALSALPSPAAKKHRLIYDMKNRPPFPGSLPGTLLREEGGKRSKDTAVNEAYNYSGLTYDFYMKLFNRNSLDDHGMSLVSSVHVGRNFNNAFWNGEQMAYGDGDGTVFLRFTKSIDVVGHELTHGVVTHTSNLEYRNETGALNEHFADVMGVLIKQWRRRQKVDGANWLIGDKIITTAPSRRALRDMANPGTAFKDDPYLGSDPQPDHMRKKYTGTSDYGGVHINSGIPNRAFHLAATAIGGYAWAKTGLIWYKTLLQLHRTSSFKDCAQITHQVARAEFGSAEPKAVKDAWAAVGIRI